MTRRGWGPGLKTAVSVAAVTAAVTMAAVPAGADTVVGAPFTWSGLTWCPTFRGANGCDSVQQSGTGSSVAFNPAQVTESSDHRTVTLAMNAAATATGAFDTQAHETWSAPATVSERITLACDASGHIDNWPAFWLDTTGAWPEGGEIDVVEGLHGQAAWHYHYLSAAGVSSQVGGAVSGFSGCGTHTYEAVWTSSAITFVYDGRQVGQVTAAGIGVPIATGPMYMVNDYAASATEGGPTVGGVSMQVSQLRS